MAGSWWYHGLVAIECHGFHGGAISGPVTGSASYRWHSPRSYPHSPAIRNATCIHSSTYISKRRFIMRYWDTCQYDIESTYYLNMQNGPICQQHMLLLAWNNLDRSWSKNFLNTAESWKPLVCGLQVKILYRNRLQENMFFYSLLHLWGCQFKDISLMLHQLLIPLKWLPPIPRCSWPSAYCPKDLSIEGHSGGFLWCWPRTFHSLKMKTSCSCDLFANSTSHLDLKGSQRCFRRWDLEGNSACTSVQEWHNWSRIS